MAGLGGKNWTFQEEVTSSDVNGYLADQVVMRFADSTARTAGFGGTGEPTLAEGMVSYLDDTNRLAYYNGSSWVDVPVVGDFGLQLIKAQTIGSAVSSVTVTDAFSADFDNYRIVIGNSNVSVSGNSWFMSISGSTGSTYNYSGDYQTYSATRTNFGAASQSSGFWLGISGGRTSSFIDIASPFLSTVTSCVATTMGDTWTSHGRSYDSNAASSASFTLTQATSGTMTGGTIRVYGYRNS